MGDYISKYTGAEIELSASCAVVVTHFSADGWVGYEPAVIVSD